LVNSISGLLKTNDNRGSDLKWIDY
jgi:hypothetical protein